MATAIETNDLLPVRSRVSWGAILAGAVVALSAYLLLSALGVAVGLSVNDNVSGNTLGIGAGIWALVSVLLSLFLGGWVATQCTAGENRLEALVYGVVVWGVFFAALLWLVASGARLGFGAMIGIASTPSATAAANRLTNEDLRAAGFTEQQVTDMRAQFDRLQQRTANIVNDPRTTAAAWWTFAGILVSMAAAVAGAVAGAGPNLILTGLRVRSTAVGMSYPARETREIRETRENINP
jgi:hypothetical protein